MQSERDSLGRRLGRALLRLAITAALLGLLGAVLYLLSERNARTFWLVAEGERAVVLKGRLLPTGAQPWLPADAALADAYAPVALEGARLDRSVLGQPFRDRDELDRALFRIFEQLARPRVASDEPAELEKGLYFLRRAERLTGITTDQRAALQRMQSEVAFYKARLKLEQARRLIFEASAQLEVASNSGRHMRLAHALRELLTGPTEALDEALRSASPLGTALEAPSPKEAEPAPPEPAAQEEGLAPGAAQEPSP
jgi:hypothetical protein